MCIRDRVQALLDKKVIAFTAEDSHRYGSPNCEAAGKQGALFGLESVSYTHLDVYKRQMYPEVQFYFIMGADSLFDFEDWREPEIISQECILLACLLYTSGTDVYQGRVPPSCLCGEP